MMKTNSKTLAFLFIFICLPLIAQARKHSEALQVKPLLKTSTSWNGKQIVYPKGKAEVTSLQIEIAPGAETGWHKHPVPSFAVILEGDLDVSLKDGKVNHLHKGDTLAEVVDTWHNGRNPGKKPVKLVVFYAGTPGQTLTLLENAKP